MEDSFELKIPDKDQTIQVKLVTYGYSYSFHATIEGVDVLYEPDEERKYRARLAAGSQESLGKPNVELIRLVGEQIQRLF
jgi:hypothetical protein